MGPHMNPGLAVAAESEFGSAIDIVLAGEDGQDYARNDNRLCCKAHENADWQELFVAPEAASVDLDCVIQHSDPDHCRDTEPLCCRVGHAAKRQSEPGNSDDKNQTEKRLTELEVFRQTLAKDSHGVLLRKSLDYKIRSTLMLAQ